MTKEQAIERLEKRIEDNEDYKTIQVWLTDDVSAVYTVLSMLQEQQKQIEHWKNGFERELEDNRKNTCELLKQDLIIRKKDRQIDLMSEQLAGLTIWNSKKEEALILTDKEDVKQYFERQVNSSKQ